ncbi:MAG TPA: TPM domain-containing protein [Gemmatimonadaceae bacterium]|nr:TPM domain-containing protein [Gemmatimonadaceae bacterium]
MKRILTLTLLAGIATVALGQSAPPIARYVPASPDPAHRFVTDAAHILSPATIVALQDSALALQAATHADVAWVTLPTLGGRAIEEAGIYIGRTWRIGSSGQPGDEDRNRGLVLLYVPDKSTTAGSNIRVEVGNGLEGTITDARSHQIIFAMRDDLRAKRYDDAYIKGWNAAAALVREDYASRTHASAPAAAPAASKNAGPSAFAIVVVVAGLGVLLMVLLRRSRRRRAAEPETMTFTRSDSPSEDDDRNLKRAAMWALFNAALNSSGGGGGGGGDSDGGSSDSGSSGGGDFGGGGGFSGGGSSDSI